MSEEAVKWLREQIEGDKSAALIISCGGFAPERWDTDPPGQVNPERMPKAPAIDALLAGDGDDPVFRLHGYWVAMHSWERENDEPEEDRVRGSDLPMAIVNDGRRETDHIRRHDPRSVVARCEAELAILERCAEAVRAGAVPEGATWSDDAAGAEVGTGVLRLLASGYKHREGYAKHWGGTDER